MASKVEVLCPNGHRVYVKITPNTKLVNILEEACTKHGFLPANDYELIHVQSRKTLDLTLNVRFSGLSNNAKLELIKAETSRPDSRVTIALQLVSGERVTAEFKPSESIWEVLKYFQKEHSEWFEKERGSDEAGKELHPVCVYLREEVIGEYALQETTLKDLGLLKGSGILRILYKPVEQSVLKDVEDKLKKQKMKQRKYLNSTSIDGTIQSSTDSTTCERNRTEDEMSTVEIKETHQSENVIDDQQSEATSECATSVNEPGTTHGRHLFSHCFEQLPESCSQTVQEQQSQSARPKQMYSGQTEFVFGGATKMPCADFKFPEETKGQELYQNEMASEREIIKCKPCERNVICYHAEDVIVPGVTPTEPDDEFFELTEADVRKMYIDLQQHLKEGDEAQLLTQAMRRAKAEERLAKYDHVFIRFTFPDKLVLQAMFRPRESIYNLYKFIREQVHDKSVPFHLFTSPPKHILEDEELTLLEAQLVPMTVVYVSFQQKVDRCLTDDLLSQMSSRLQADKKIVEMMRADSLTTSSSRMAETSTQHANSSAKSKLPKWFKLNPK